jgi:four helix bundle protein
MAYQSFEDLDVWQRACRQAVTIFQTFEDCKNWTLRDQIQRAALSVPSNVAEGCERNSPGDFNRFLNIALGSNGELRTQLYIARKLEFLNKRAFDALLSESKEISAMLRGLAKSLSRRRQPLNTEN